MKLMLRIFCAIGAAGMMVGAAQAVGIAQGLQVLTVRVDKAGQGYVQFASALTGTPPACGANNGHNRHLAFDTRTDGGRAIYSLVLSAKATDSPIVAEGTGTCTIYAGVIEDWNYGWIQ